MRKSNGASNVELANAHEEIAATSKGVNGFSKFEVRAASRSVANSVSFGGEFVSMKRASKQLVDIRPSNLIRGCPRAQSKLLVGP